MKNPCGMMTIVVCGLLGLSGHAWAQGGGLPGKPPSSLDAPSDPGMRDKPDPSIKAPADPGMVVEPPKAGTGMVKRPPENIDPKMDSATSDIERKNREKSKDKAAQGKAQEKRRDGENPQRR